MSANSHVHFTFFEVTQYRTLGISPDQQNGIEEPNMTAWIEHAQRFVASHYNDRAALEAAIATCENDQIQEFLTELSIQSQVHPEPAEQLAEQLEQDGQEVPALMVRFLTYLPTFLQLESPLRLSPADRESLFLYARAFAAHLKTMRELLPSASWLCLARGTGMYYLRNFPAAREAYEEARDIYRALAAQDSETYSPDLAGTLNNLGNLLRVMRHFPPAHDAFKEALEIHRALATQDPESYGPDLATTLNNLGALLADMRHFPAARQVYEEALKIRRVLAAQDPESYRADVAMTLNNLGSLLADVRDFPAARHRVEEALEIRRTLAAQDPETYLPNVATTLNNLGTLRDHVGDVPAARQAFEEALEIQYALAAQHPQAYLPDVAMTLSNLGMVQDPPAAREALEEALEIRRALAVQDPESYGPSIARSLHNLGNRLRDMGDFPAARQTYEEALEILATQNLESCRSDVVMTLNNLGMLLHRIGDVSGARQAHEHAVALTENVSHSEAPQHLSKVFAHAAYRYLLADAIAAGDKGKTFAFFASIRDGPARVKDLGRRQLREVQDLLKQQQEQHGVPHRLLVADVGPEDTLTLGLIDQDDTHFVFLQAHGWTDLFPDGNTPDNNPMRLRLAREIWQALPNEFQAALKPTTGKSQWIGISGDPFWNAFPWELLRFGEGAEDYLGLHQALPRLGAIQSQHLEQQLALNTLGLRGGRTTVLAPFDTLVFKRLKGVVEEVDSVKQAVESRGGHMLAFAKGSQATNVEIERHIALEPDIFYFSGHGDVLQDEEVLLLHRDLTAPSSASSLFFFGKEHLVLLSEQRNGKLFPQRPLVVLNSCMTGRGRDAGGKREDLVSGFLAQGAGAVIATALPIYDDVGKALGQALFDSDLTSAADLASVVVATRRRLAKTICSDVNSPYWGAWAMIHLHGGAHSISPFDPIDRGPP